MKKTGSQKAKSFVPLLFICFISFLFGEDASEPTVRALKIRQPISIDGELNEPEWKEYQPVTIFTQREPQEGKSASESTEVRVLYDENYLYIGFICFDSEPDKVVSNEMRRDAELKDNDYFEVVLDTFHNHRNAFYFSVNPLGAKRDALIRDGGTHENSDWDGIWLAKARRSKQGWLGEIAIPFHTLRFDKRNIRAWGVNFGRHIARKREEAFWAPLLRDYGMSANLNAAYFGHLTGLESLSQQKKYQIMPYLIGGGKKIDQSHSLDSSGQMGLDLKYSLTSNLTTDLTINTDFAQVEADQEQFNLTRFSLFFPEKRSFFLEDADIFLVGEKVSADDSPETVLFFSRRIGLSNNGKEIPLIGGIKITGKEGSYDLGFLNILTDRVAYKNGNEFTNIEKTNYSVFRVKRDLFNKSTFGAMLLSKDSLDSSDYNRSAAFDFNLAFGRFFRMAGYGAKTFTPGLRGKDWASFLDLVYESDSFSLSMLYQDIGKNFNEEMGFISRAGIRKIRTNLSFRPRPGILNIRKSFFFNKFIYVENSQGKVETKYIQWGNQNVFQNGGSFFWGFVQNYEYLYYPFEIKRNVFIPPGGHNFNQFKMTIETDQSNDISFNSSFVKGNYYNGRLFSVNSTASLKASRNFSMEIIYNRNQFDFPVNAGKFNVNILASRIVYAFSPDLFVKAYIQWNDNEKLYKSNFHVRWIYKPGANVYFIYNETREIGEEGFLRDRMVMLKVSFLFNW